MKKSLTKKLFRDIISFGTPAAIVINIFLIFLLLSLIPTSTFEQNDSFCIFKNYIIPLFFEECPNDGLFENCECPACGMTRAMSSLLHGNFNTALEYNKGIIPLMIAMLSVWFVNMNKWYKFYKKEKRCF